MRLLLAETDAVTREYLAECARDLGFDAVVVESTVDAGRSLEEDRAPRIVLLGVHDLEVVEALCDRLRTDDGRRHTYVILLVGREQRRWSASLLASGRVDDCLGKPADAHDLEARLLVARRALALRERLQQARSRLDSQAAKDGLTQLWGREATLGFLARELARARRSGDVVGVVRVTLEGLRAINRSLGLETGDEALQRVAEILETSVRSSDWVGRVSGRRFLMVLPGCGEQRGDLVCARVRRSVTDRVARGAIELPGLEVECRCETVGPDSSLDVEGVLALLSRPRDP